MRASLAGAIGVLLLGLVAMPPAAAVENHRRGLGQDAVLAREVLDQVTPLLSEDRFARLPIVVRGYGTASWLGVAPAIQAALVAEGCDVRFDNAWPNKEDDDFRRIRYVFGERVNVVVSERDPGGDVEFRAGHRTPGRDLCPEAPGRRTPRPVLPPGRGSSISEVLRPMRRWGQRLGGQGALGVAMAFANVVSYLVVLALSRSLGPQDFGGFSALSAYGIVLAVPAGAFQVVVARRMSVDHRDMGGVRAAVWVGAGLAAVTLAATPLLTEALRLDSRWAVVWLAVTLLPMTLTGAFQGLLLGRGRLAALSALYISIAVGRLAAVAVASTFVLGVSEVFALLLIATLLSALLGAGMCRHDLLRGGRSPLWGELARAIASLGAFIALTNIDVPLARMYLPDYESGGYALAASFARAVGWGTQFVALLVVTRMRGAQAVRSLRRAHGLVLLLGLAAVGAIALDPSWWIVLAGGARYAEFGTLAVACVALGVLWALVQVSLFAEMGRDSVRLGWITWAVVGLEIAAIAFWFHRTPYELLAVCGIGAVVVLVSGWFLERVGVRSGSISVTAEL